jgi:hypothetical protein
MPDQRCYWLRRGKLEYEVVRLTAGSRTFATLLVLALLTAAPASSHPARRIEVSVQSKAPDARIVRESYVSLYAPLPASDGPHPAACDRIGYLRFRSARGPLAPSRADAVFVIMPGIFAGASMLDQTARNIVRAAAARHSNVEVWALDRRSNCLEDHWGLTAAARNRNARLAIDYYYRGARVDGRRFGGFVTEQQAAWLSHVGLEQTVRDEYAVISQIPAPLRSRKVFCGGHSLGGPITGAFADWDFGAGPSQHIPGYAQCAAFFALDTRLSLGSGSGSSGGGGDLGAGAQLAAASGMAMPYINAPPFTPETIEAPEVVGVGAYYGPRQPSEIAKLLPRDPSFELSDRLLFSRDAANFLTGSPSIRDFAVTGNAALGAIFDDNSSPIVILRAGLGVFSGGPVAEKNFPLPYGSSTLAGLLGGGRLMVPAIAHGPLYTWRNYNQLSGPGTIPRDDHGHPYTAPVDEVSDIHQLARVMFEAPADFVEEYFPTRLVADLQAAESGERGGQLAPLRYDGIGKRPAFYLDAQNGIEAGASAPPLTVAPSGWMVLPGYHHLDVATAAFRQNNRRPNILSAALVKFALRVLGRGGG